MASDVATMDASPEAPLATRSSVAASTADGGHEEIQGANPPPFLRDTKDNEGRTFDRDKVAHLVLVLVLMLAVALALVFSIECRCSAGGRAYSYESSLRLRIAAAAPSAAEARPEGITITCCYLPRMPLAHTHTTGATATHTCHKPEPRSEPRPSEARGLASRDLASRTHLPIAMPRVLVLVLVQSTAESGETETSGSSHMV
ncbi:hypothetical protein M431DRAFT_530088 [Trichoderma harzianum CBS 226.95]|uniref:Uncharacterized protein n=1 Tax=Trichoderma harzianum CBS 226.95 TaxID=983964 RepID=A0A2T4AEJ7_TRIHA|nr:hypothetical protein M431DRAFT_530088 [Trichoderma harzianum CBS 226.95]PTB55510.1 hypothetical protein M431DRAFT_530088 [Trichoderma harzianum CBS 226.95]